MTLNKGNLRYRSKSLEPPNKNKNAGLEDKKTENGEDSNKIQKPYRYGPMPRFSGQRLWSKLIIIAGILFYVWYSSVNKNIETTLARYDTIYMGRAQNVECDPQYLEEISQYTGCVPKKCGRYLSDNVISIQESDTLLDFAKRGMALGGSDGGATIMDLHSGALSLGKKFVNIYKMDAKLIELTDIAFYRIVKEKIKHFVAESFGIDIAKLYLTHPTFFSRLTNAEPKTEHDEYWHVHVDKHTYESFHYTSLLYLTDYNTDFRGGRFVFLDHPQTPRYNFTVEPRRGRVLSFTSGTENPHFVEKVLNGERYAITVSFTCDKMKAIKDPLLRPKCMALGGSDGGATIMDLHSGALSLGKKFVNVYKMDAKLIELTDIAFYRIVKEKIKHFVAESFGIDIAKLYLTHPTFFSRLTNAEPKTEHDEYWHVHVDKHTYESFHYTSLLYLTDYNTDFRGGRFVFLDHPQTPRYNFTVEPRRGRVLSFTSGTENPHFVEKVLNGERYAITVSFTCDKMKAIKDPLLRPK